MFKDSMVDFLLIGEPLFEGHLLLKMPSDLFCACELAAPRLPLKPFLAICGGQQPASVKWAQHVTSEFTAALPLRLGAQMVQMFEILGVVSKMSRLMTVGGQLFHFSFLLFFLKSFVWGFRRRTAHVCWSCLNQLQIWGERASSDKRRSAVASWYRML